MRYTVFDIESDGLLYPEEDSPVATGIHCLCVATYDSSQPDVVHTQTITDYAAMAAYLNDEHTGVLIGHNIIRYDKPMLEKFTGVRITKQCYDTLALSWYLYPNRARDAHNLADWGEDLGVPKIQIDDWSQGNLFAIIERCEQDVVITGLLFHRQLSYLKRIYEGMSIIPIMDYLTFKMSCAAEQEKVRWKADRALATENLAILEAESIHKTEILSSVMPPVTVYKKVTKPKKPTKKDGELSATGARWIAAMEIAGIEDDEHIEEIKIPKGTIPGAPTTQQLKKWLFSLGWQPITFKYVKEENPDGTYTERAIPQISLVDGSGLCSSVKELIEANPELEHLDGLFTVNSRKNNVKGILKHITDDDYVTASILGFTNTLRFQHGNPLVNLPGVAKRYGEYVRSVLIAPEGFVLCGSDMKSLEDSTKRHYMWDYDPDYVTEMMDPDFDPHIDMGLQGGLLTPEEVAFYRWYNAQDRDYPFTAEEKQKMKVITDKRKNGKQVNFASVYGASPKKIHLTSRMPLALATKLHNTYWKRNWSVKKIAEDIYYKTVDGQMWMYNPVSRFWYSLRYVKDIFSTLNQGTGVFCFDTQVKNVRKRGIKICGQFHDEWIAAIPEGTENEVMNACNEAIRETNAELKLNVTLGISVQFGPRYSDIH